MASTKINLVDSDKTLTQFKDLISTVVGDSVEQFLKIKLNKASIFDEIVTLIGRSRDMTFEDYQDIDTFLGINTREYKKIIIEKNNTIDGLKRDVELLRQQIDTYENKSNVDLIIHDMITDVVDEAVEEDEEKEAEDEEKEEDEDDEDEADEEEVDENEEEADEEEEAEDDEEEEVVEEEAEEVEKEDEEEVDVEEAEEEEEEDEEELVEIEVDGVTYYTNDEDLENGDIFEVLADDEPGEIVGKVKDGDITFFNEN